MVDIKISDLDVHPKIIESAFKGGYSNAWKVIEASLDEIRSKTGLTNLDIRRLQIAASQCCSPASITASNLELEAKGTTEIPFINLGCKELDDFLRGGIPCRGITEIAGESGSGKTQILLQLAIRAQLSKEEGGKESGVAYICTENHFPVNRLNQLGKLWDDKKSFNGKAFSDNIFVQHLPDMDQLADCILYKISRFISSHSIKVLIIDSIAAVFRADEGSHLDKTKILKQIGYKLHKLSSQEGIMILIANQVTASFGKNFYGIAEDMIPALGLSWANFVTTRIMLWKSSFCVMPPTCTVSSTSLKYRVRNLEVLFCPWLPRRCFPFVVTEFGVQDAVHFTGKHLSPQLCT